MGQNPAGGYITGLETHLDRRFHDLDFFGALSALALQSAALQDDTTCSKIIFSLGHSEVLLG